ncbi:MAG: trypsin-like peptidase domain-containing protein [Pirellulales bacterium]
MAKVVTLVWLAAALALAATSHTVRGEESLETLERLVAADPKPFVLVEAAAEGSVGRGQGVVISPQGHVLSVGHVSWNGTNRQFTDKFRVSFRGPGQEMPQGVVHVHKTVFSDREDATFLEHYYSARLQKQGETRFIGGGDLALFKIEAQGTFPTLDFFSDVKPKLQSGEVLHLCHYSFPDNAADPTFLINPLEVVGVAQTSCGPQYLAKGFYRVGSSGGAILKEGRLIGIQSAAYTVNAKGVGEIPLGLISFQLVWRDLVKEALQEP